MTQLFRRLALNKRLPMWARVAAGNALIFTLLRRYR